MTAKNKGEFLFELHNELHRIGIDADDEIFADFEEHFNAGMEQGISEEETCRRLGDPKEIARNYFEIRSSRINSIVADAIEQDRPHVSLTKPGKSVPADISLAKPEPIREVTPEHILTEEEAIAQNSNTRSANSFSPVREVTPEHIAAEPESNSNPADILNGLIDEKKSEANAQREVTPKHIAAETVNSEPIKPNNAYTAGSIPVQGNSQEASHNQDRSGGSVPPQSVKKVGDNGGMLDWTLLKGRKPDIDSGRLITLIILDIFVFSWLIPMLASLGISVASGGISVICTGVGILFGSVTYYFISRVFLTIAMVSLGCIIIMLGALIIKGMVKLIRKLIDKHLRAIFNIYD